MRIAKNKKERIKIKRRRIQNKKLIKKYPWLRANDWLDQPIKGYDITWADEIPEGWRKAFGNMMIEEIDEVLKRTHTTIHIDQIKEKYGQLRFYFSGTAELHDIVEKYSMLSENICIICGKPDIPMIDTGWVCPICQECFEDNQRKNHLAHRYHYMDYVCGDSHMADEMRWWRYEDDVKKEYVVDIKDTADKIRARYSNYRKKYNFCR